MPDTLTNFATPEPFEPPQPTEPPKPPKPPRKPFLSFLDRWFDAHNEGDFAKRLVIIMLLIASVVQPPALLYTAYGDNLPTWWWDWAPALGIFLFLAMDWTILPLGYFFATTNKPGLKIILFLLLAMVAIGAFDGYFATAERLISMRVQSITAVRLRVEAAEANVAKAKQDLQDRLKQQANDRVIADKQRDEFSKQVAQIDEQIAAAQANAQREDADEKGKLDVIRKACRIAADPNCMRDKLAAEQRRFSDAQANSRAELERLQAAKGDLDAKLAALNADDQSKVNPANDAVDDAQKIATKAHDELNVAVLSSQVYRWAGSWYRKSPSEVTAEEANRLLDMFALTVALAYVLAQILLSISYYGKNRAGLVQTHREFVRERINRAWERMIKARQAYWVRKRRPVYRDRIKEVPTTVYQDREVTKEVFVPTAERTKVIYVPVPPGGPVPPAEEFVRKANFEGIQ